MIILLRAENRVFEVHGGCTGDTAREIRHLLNAWSEQSGYDETRCAVNRHAGLGELRTIGVSFANVPQRLAKKKVRNKSYKIKKSTSDRTVRDMHQGPQLPNQTPRGA